MELLQLNKFGDLHNGRDIIFCKTDYLKDEFKKIAKFKNEVILISGNGDEGIASNLTSLMPDNIRFWYCQNNLTYHERLISIPIGLENTSVNKRKGHGVAWPHAVEKINLLNEVFNSNENSRPSQFLYANFNTQTNTAYRKPVKEICINTPFINWDEPSLNYPGLIKKVLDHEATICPAGNGIDTHRLYEVLYCKRVAVTIKIGNYPVYNELYKKLPVVILDKVEDLQDQDKLKELIGIAQQKKENLQLIDFAFWKASITGAANKIPESNKSVFRRFFNRDKF
ncbi:hypothetical protein [Mucilaginibacter gotjawali]|uniref:Exostosin family protein n=1 Tax=Mucilaginibacter gotjawali TaxID=1550579 RepID=A0A839SJP5_9SPHI|nr:hypothetical protein [Mucilaginibacter gotjawali]MBB3057090.1 hypothetical protein [Mucilaginibacter gotjawali]